MLQTIVRKNQYQDSVALMVLSRTLSDLDGVAKVSVMMGTPANKQILADTGFSTPELDDAAPSDLVIGVDADDQETVDSVLAQASELNTFAFSVGILQLPGQLFALLLAVGQALAKVGQLAGGAGQRQRMADGIG